MTIILTTTLTLCKSNCSLLWPDITVDMALGAILTILALCATVYFLRRVKKPSPFGRAYVSAGHDNRDSGAVANGWQENKLTQKVRNRVSEILIAKGYSVINDNDDEKLAAYLNRIKTGDGSVVVEFHFDYFNGKASGTTALVSNSASVNSRKFAAELSKATAHILGIPNRGVKTEAESNRGSLALVHKQGIACLLEICFIDNPTDMTAFTNPAKFEQLCLVYAVIIGKFDDLIP